MRLRSLLPRLERARDARTAPPAPPRDRFDAAWARGLEDEVLGPMIRVWFRPQLLGAWRLPDDGPAILAGNHSGNCLPYDALALDAYLWKRDGMRPEKKIRTVFESALAQAWWLSPYGVNDFWRRGGGVDMSFDNFDRLLRRGDRVMYYPEGVPGIGKGFQNRYRLQRFHTSFLLLAHRHDIPVQPVYVVNAEWVMPFHFTIRWVDRVFQLLFRVPFLPLPAGVLAIVFPWLWYLALPARMVFVVGEPIDVNAMLRDAGVAHDEAPTRAQLDGTAERVRQRMQAELTALVEIHGKRQYDFRGLWRALRDAGSQWWRALPVAWPVTFHVHERNRARPAARNRLHAILRDLDLVAFYLPFGWPLLTLVRRLRRPPYGFRGLSAFDRREREGSFFWRLSERPLPPREAGAAPTATAPPREAAELVGV